MALAGVELLLLLPRLLMKAMMMVIVAMISKSSLQIQVM
jgi:hypothetical protein